MKFDYVIGNPPYQDETANEGDRKPPIYHLFMDESYKIASVAELITPARFLFNAGQTPKVWNKKMLSDPHLRVIQYEADASGIFPTTEIKGGVAITIHDTAQNYGAIEVFTPYNELNDIVQKVRRQSKDGFLDAIVSSRGCYRFSDELIADFPYVTERLGKGTGNMLVSNFFEKMPEAIESGEGVSTDATIDILCRVNKARTICRIKEKYLLPNDFVAYYNVASPEANGNGRFGEKLTASEILKPREGATDTFVSLGIFKTEREAKNLQKYISTKFFRALLGVNKVTQHCPPAVWKMIPVQDFTTSSDIDWSQSIADIDQQLYKKYGLSSEEIEFIETHVKEME